MLIKCKGILRYLFHNEYKAAIALSFSNSEHAKQALKILGSNWKSYLKDNRALTWVGDSEQLSIIKKQLKSYGADESAIDSISKSIDFGEGFYCEIKT